MQPEPEASPVKVNKKLCQQGASNNIKAECIFFNIGDKLYNNGDSATVDMKSGLNMNVSNILPERADQDCFIGIYGILLELAAEEDKADRGEYVRNHIFNKQDCCEVGVQANAVEDLSPSLEDLKARLSDNAAYRTLCAIGRDVSISSSEAVEIGALSQAIMSSRLAAS